MRPKGLGSCTGKRFEHWSQPSLSFVGAPLNHGCSYMVTEFLKPSFGRSNTSRKFRGRPTGREFRGGAGGRKWYNRRGGKTKNDWYAYFSFYHGVSSPLQHQGIAYYVRESFIWHWRRATRPPRPLSEDYHVLFPRSSLPKVEGAAADFELPEMMQATFYAMLLNEAIELGVIHGFMAEGLRSALMSRVNQEMREAQLRQQAVEGEVRGPSDGQEKSSGSTSPPPPSSNEE
ncbi:hypothetical protein Cgig2_010218 [Carnegiea gigantea]|uniref:Uncharacterized protein n=1 Tax=Carnegiea gigantea TaxID=171969 RepID=A0A9Q1JU04_9CARY|nr:hypothetical protein Cgig2_010218 [Carnegiea gigantea]